jgi:hypothetical protein
VSRSSGSANGFRSDDRAVLPLAVRPARCIYQPLFYDAGPPRLERMARILFAIAASKPDPVPIVRRGYRACPMPHEREGASVLTLMPCRRSNAA